MLLPPLQVKPYSKSTSGQTLYLMRADGSAPDIHVVEDACRMIGGKLVENSEHCGHASTIGDHRFSFSFLDRQWRFGWGGSAESPASSVTSN